MILKRLNVCHYYERFNAILRRRKILSVCFNICQIEARQSNCITWREKLAKLFHKNDDFSDCILEMIGKKNISISNLSTQKKIIIIIKRFHVTVLTSRKCNIDLHMA